MSENRVALIWDSVEPTPDNDEYKVLWQNYTVIDLETERSIPQLVEENAVELRSKYLSFIYDLGEIKNSGKRIIDELEISENFSFWWMTLLVEKCNYSKSPQIDNIIKLMAFEKWLDGENFSTIKIATNNQQLANSIKILADQSDVTFEWIKLPLKKSTENIIRRIYNGLPDIIKAPIMFSYYLFDRWKFKGLGFEKLKKSTATVTFASYFFTLDIEAANRRQFKERYWTKLPDLLEKDKIGSNWLHVFVKSDFLPTAASAKKLLKDFNETESSLQNHLFIDSFLSLQVIKRTIVDWIIMVSKYSKIKSGIKRQASYLWPLIKTDLKVSLVGVASIQNLLHYHLFRNAMQMMPAQQKGFYLQENQGWEFGFVGAWREFEHGEMTGVAHATVRYWDLRYFFDEKTYTKNNSLNIPLPDKVAINGEAAKKQYLDGGYALDNLIEVEALRYLQLEKLNSFEKSLQYQDESPNNILVLGDYLQKNTKQQMELLLEAYKLITVKVHFIVKPHPMCPILLQDYEELDISVTDKPIDELIGECVMAYTSSVTSAAVDVYYVGKKVVTMLDQATLNLSPLRGCKGVSFVKSSNELADIINNFAQIEVDEDQGRDFFYLDQELPRWKKLLSDNVLSSNGTG